jgi:hypothetical protein
MIWDLVCKKTKCPDYSTDDGDPAWCNWAGCPAMVAVNKCPKVIGYHEKETKKQRESNEIN